MCFVPSGDKSTSLNGDLSGKPLNGDSDGQGKPLNGDSDDLANLSMDPEELRSVNSQQMGLVCIVQ